MLACFVARERAACRAYRAFLRDGLPHGRHPELVVGSLFRSLGGWGYVRAMRRREERMRADPRPALLAHPLRRSRRCGFLVAGHARNQGEQSARCDSTCEG